MAEYITKNWGWTTKVTSVNGKSDCWIGWMNPAHFTSVHRHRCKSVITCIDGELFVSLQGDGSVPVGSGNSVSLKRGQSVVIHSGEWHALIASRVDFSEGRQTIFHEWYDLEDGEYDYPIERYEGALS